MHMKKWSAAVLVAAGVLGLAGCGGSDKSVSPQGGESGIVTVSGSSALLPLAKDAAESFKAKNPNVSITLNAGGSGTGLKQVADGTVDIGNSDVPAEEKLPKDKAAQLKDHKVCVLVIAPVVNKDVGASVKSLTKQQLQDVFAGKVKNWKDVGGPDNEIVLVSRPSTSGTRVLFKSLALDGGAEAETSSLETDDSGTLMQMIAQTKGAIGYVATPYLKANSDVVALGIDGVMPTLENTYSGKWKVWGYEHMYTKGEPKGAVKTFIDYILSDTYGKEIEKQGYGVSGKMKAAEKS